MTIRNFNNVTTVGTLSGPASPSDVFLSVAGFSNYPAVPFTATIDRNTVSEEIVLVTAVNTGTLTVTRGYNGSAATSHLAGGTVEHTAIALDFTEANTHVNATENVHGTSGELVGSEGAQTLMDKTLVSPLVEADATLGDAVVASIPEGAEARNLFRGMNAAGDDVVVIDSDGVVTNAGEHVVGNSEVDGNQQIDGNLTVAGTADFTGKVTADDVEVTGDLTAPTVAGSTTFTGEVTTPELNVKYLELQLSSVPANPPAGFNRMYLGPFGNLTLQTSAGVTHNILRSRAITDWSTDTGFNGDMGIKGSDIRFYVSGVGWRQYAPLDVANAAARTALASADKYEGFLVRETDSDRVYEWTGSAWRYLYGGVKPIAVANLVDPVSVATAVWQTVVLDAERIDTWSAMSSGRFVAPVAGYYKASGATCWASNATGYRTCKIVRATAAAPTTYIDIPGSSVIQSAVSGAPTAVPTPEVFVLLAAGDVLAMQVSHSAGVSLNLTGTAVNPEHGTALSVELVCAT